MSENWRDHLPDRANNFDLANLESKLLVCIVPLSS